MRYKLYLWLLALLWIAVAVMAFTGCDLAYIAGVCAAGVLLTLMLWRAVHKPLEAVNNGIYLLREQDFSSRLRTTGQSDADKVVRLFNTMMDAMKAERLKQQEQSRLLGLLTEASPMGVAICDFDGHIVSRNKAYTTLATPQIEQQLMEMGDDEVRTVRTDGSQVVRCSRLWFMDSGFRRRFFLVELMTEEILRAEKQMFNKIVRTIGHEVNNTMGSVVSVLDTLALMHEGDEDVVQTINSSGTSCMNLAEFVKGYASVVKLPAPAPVPVNLDSYLNETLPSLRGMAPDNISVAFTPSGSDTTVMIDEMLMHRVLTNIVKNAVESIADKPDGRIEITALPHGIKITDNGAGVEPATARQLFSPFFSTKRADRGLGLMLVADILRAHKATFSLSTDHATMLTTFNIRFK